MTGHAVDKACTRGDAGLPADEVADAFGLGMPVRPPSPVPGGLMNSVWRLDTDRGSFAVKQFHRDFDNAAYMPGLAQGGRVEQAALVAGIPMPQPIAVPGTDRWLIEIPRAGGPPHTIRVHAWVDGRSPGPRDDPVELGAGIGALLARLHALNLPAAETVVDLLSVRRIDDWHVLAGRVTGAGLPWASRLVAALPALEELESMILRGRDDPDRPIGTHCDADKKNVLLTPDGRMLLIDWDWAGPCTARHEITTAALGWAGVWAGDPDPSVVRAVLAGYRDAGGRPFEPDITALASFFSGELGWLYFNVRRCLGESLHGADDREIAGREVDRLLDNLPRFARTYERWLLLLKP